MSPDHGSAGGGSSGGNGGTAGSEGGTATEPAPAPKPKRTQASKSRFESRPSGGKGTTRSLTGDLVSGELLGAPAEDSSQPLQPAAASARRGRLEGSSGGGIPAAAWGVLTTLGLLAAGALVEARQLGPGLRVRLGRGGSA